MARLPERLVLVQGGGVGFDQEESLRTVLAAAGVHIAFEVHFAGRAAVERGLGALPTPTLDAVRAAGVALKTKLLPSPQSSPPKHGAMVPANDNVAFRKSLGLYASVRPVRNLPGLPARFEGIDFHLVREITEDLYTSSEHEVVPGVVQSFKIVTEAACLRFFEFAFRLAERLGRKSVHCIHKANILKQADGLTLDCFRRVAQNFPAVTPKELIVDNACMQMVTNPRQFEVVAAGNLYGDLLSDLGAGLVGGISSTAAVNHGDALTVYEAVYGASHEAVPPGTANPLPLILPTLELLTDHNEAEAATRIRTAIGRVLSTGTTRTRDLGGTATTEEFTQAIVAAMGA